MPRSQLLNGWMVKTRIEGTKQQKKHNNNNSGYLTDAHMMVYLYVRANNEWRVRVKCRTKTKMHNVKIGSATQFLCKNSGYGKNKKKKNTINTSSQKSGERFSFAWWGCVCVCALFFFFSFHEMHLKLDILTWVDVQKSNVC